MARGRSTLELFTVGLGIVWWTALVLLPVQLLLALTRAAGLVGPGFADANRSVRVLGDTPGIAEGWAYFSVELTRLPPLHAAVVAVLQAAAAALWLPVVRQLHAITRHMAVEPFDHTVVRRMRLVGPLVAAAGVGTSLLEVAGSWVAAAAVPVPGAEVEVSIGPACWGIVAAGVAVILTEVVRRGADLREDTELTV